MPPVSDWSFPNEFTLTNPFNGSLVFNRQTADGIYLLDNQKCHHTIATRVTKDHIPQADGDILHYRFLTGVEIALSIQLWENKDTPACDDLLGLMLDELSGALRSLLNAGDNEGRLAWEVNAGASNTRMQDDCRLLVYPVPEVGEVLTTVNATIDSAFPYAQDLTQVETPVADGATVAIDNTGNAAYYPVYKVYGASAGFTITLNGTDLISTAGAIDPGDYVEVDTFKNTMFLNGDEDDELNTLIVVSSKFSPLLPGSNTVLIEGASMDVLWAPAWA